MSRELDWLGESGHGFLDAVAARQPTPGGGSVAAAAGALAAAMARMVAAYSPGGGAGADAVAAVRGAAEELAEADRMLRRLVNEDAAAYQFYANARKSAAAGERERATALALAVPMETVAVGCAVLRTLDRCKEAWNRNLISDLGVAAVLAEACVRAAAYNVRINLKLSPEADPRGEIEREMQELLDHAGALLSSVSEFVDVG
jgi:glutamate formiminotransferase/formiminotetrahydrofolate cyclodeaminase